MAAEDPKSQSDLAAFTRAAGVRGVVWPRTMQTEDGRIIHKYVVVVALVSDQPIPGLEGNEVVLSGPLTGGARAFPEALSALPRGHARHRLGDATDVLLSLQHGIADGPAPEDPEE